jgi:7,8-dihydro-6-hydroxymethylpterin-pyrophosphokinase
MRPHRVAVALGSTVGDRRAHLDYAVDRLRGLLAMISLQLIKR